MALHRYVFRSTWRLRAEVAQVYEALEDLGRYPLWWPQVRSVARVEDDAALVRCRSLLPYELVLLTYRQRADREAGVLEARLEGHLAGWSRWTIGPAEAGTQAIFDEEVVIGRPLLRAVDPFARPLLRANHAVMMRGGERGLRAHLAVPGDG